MSDELTPWRRVTIDRVLELAANLDCTAELLRAILEDQDDSDIQLTLMGLLSRQRRDWRRAEAAARARYAPVYPPADQ